MQVYKTHPSLLRKVSLMVYQKSLEQSNSYKKCFKKSKVLSGYGLVPVCSILLIYTLFKGNSVNLSIAQSTYTILSISLLPKRMVRSLVSLLFFKFQAQCSLLRIIENTLYSIFSSIILIMLLVILASNSEQQIISYSSLIYFKKALMKGLNQARLYFEGSLSGRATNTPVNDNTKVYLPN